MLTPPAAFCIMVSIKDLFYNLQNVSYAPTRATRVRYCIIGHYYAYIVFEENKPCFFFFSFPS